jgi:hypothetical protein
MHIFYRISDKSYDKPKLIGANKEVCFLNFCNVFAEVIFGSTEVPPDSGWACPMRIIADRCERKTNKMLAETGIPVTFTDKGNAGSLRFALEAAIEECPEQELIYFVEDDYLHLSKAPGLLEEGIRRGDYVTLYDHPDKYTRHYNMGEYSKVIKTASSHWRYTASTCMTFATTVGTLKDDLDVWKKYTDESHPHDHHIFTELGKKGRKLAVSIPGAACHTDLWYSGQMKQVLIDQWAIEMMIEQLEGGLSPDGLSMLKEKKGWERLVMLDALRQNQDK